MTYHPDENTSAENDETSRFTLSRIIDFKSPRHRAVISVVLLAVVILLTVGIILCLNRSSNECTSGECKRSADDLQKFMNLSVDPCEDFYAYVCGKGVVEADDYSRPKRHVNFGKTSKLQPKIKNRPKTRKPNHNPKPKTTTHRPKPTSHPTKRRKPYNHDEEVYKAFVKRNAKKISALKVMPTLINDLGLPTIPKLLNRAKPSQANYSFDWVRSVAQIQRALGLNVFVRFDVVEDHLKSDRNRLTLGCNNVDVLSTMSTDAEEFARDLQELVQLINPNDHLVFHKSKFLTEAKALVKFRNSLLVIDAKAAGEDLGYYTAAELQNVTNSSHPVWQPYLDVLFADLPSVKPAVNGTLQLGAKNVRCIGNLINVLSKQPPAIVELYVWLAVTTHSINNWEFLDKTKPRVEQMFTGIRSEFTNMVQKTNWMDSATKTASITRSQTTSSLIGFPKWILDFSTLKEHYQRLQTDRVQVLENWLNTQKLLNSIKLQFWQVKNHTIWDKDVAENNVNYLRTYKVLRIPRTTIRYPFYYRGLEVLNYEGLGEILGRKMAVGLDGSGQWWSNKTVQNYNNRTSCLANQTNGSSTVQNNIGGLRAALGAYREYVKKNGPEQLLPRFNNFTHEQLFFISYGNHFCETTKRKSSLSKVHVHNVLSNMEDFSRVFKCPKGSGMNPKKNCQNIW